MTTTQLPTSQLTPEQLEFRKTRIGSSDIAAIAGLNPWSGPIDVWLEKMGKSTREQTAGSRLGNLVEACIAQVYAEDNPTVSLFVPQPATFSHPERSWQAASPDRLCLVDGAPGRVLEIKLVGRRVAHHWDDGTPVYVTTQALWQCDVSDLPEAHIAAAICGTEWHLDVVEWDEDTVGALRDVGERFYRDHMLTKRPPAIDASETWRDYFKDLHPRVTKPMAEASERESELARRWLQARRRKADADQAESLLQNQLIELVGDREGVRGEGWRLMLKQRKGTDKRVFDLREVKSKKRRS